jgi:RHS repeat-associated protein
LAINAVQRSSGSGDLFKVESRMAEVAAALQTFSYDHDGNLTGDGLVDYSWDAENRLIRMETSVAARSAGFPHRKITFRYDYLGRRVQKRVVDVTQSLEVSSRRFLYDGWNLVAEYAAPGGTGCGALVRSYTWGLDIVTSLSQSGGVGALLQIADHPSGKTDLPAYDGNGNVAALFNASTGSVAAAYEYSPFGEPLRTQTSDQSVADNPFRFSTKYTDVETGLVFYGRRYYSPSQGRFLGRDLIEEQGGLHLYSICQSDPINAYDYLGMQQDPTTDLARLLAQAYQDYLIAHASDAIRRIMDSRDSDRQREEIARLEGELTEMNLMIERYRYYLCILHRRPKSSRGTCKSDLARSDKHERR